MTQSTPFRYVRDAALVPRPSAPFRYVRDAALVPRPSTPFRWERDKPVPYLLRGHQIDANTLGLDRLTFDTVRILSTTSVDLTDVDITTIYTVPANTIVVPLGILIEATIATDVTDDAEISLGLNGTADIFALETMVNFRASTNIWTNWLVLSNSRAAIDYQFIKLNVQTGAAATALIADVHLIGFSL
jgi:hypothetical protein